MRIFVSYSRHDVTAVEEIVADLEAAHHDVWRDERLAGGQDWWNRLLEEIRGADVFLFALTHNSLSSVPCRREYEYAAALGKPILPVRLDRTTSVQELPPALSLVQWVQYEEHDKHSSLDLLGSLQALPLAPPLPSPLPPPPPVPVSYLDDLLERISSPETLTEPELLAIVVELESRLQAQDDPIAIGNLARRLGRRSDLARPVERRLKRLRKRIDSSQPQPHRNGAGQRGILVAAAIAVVALGAVAVLLTRDNSQVAAPDTIAPTTQPTTTAAPSTATTEPGARTDQPVASVPPPETQPPGSTVPPVSIDLAELVEQLGKSNLTTDLGCTVEVENYAANLGLPWQYFGTDLWYWNPAVLGWLRWDGFIFYPGPVTYFSFCTNRQWNSTTGTWF